MTAVDPETKRIPPGIRAIADAICAAKQKDSKCLPWNHAETEMPGWQPIETAPRDGTPVDLWHRQGFRITEQWWDADDEIWVPETRDDEDLSHWMPIPDGPK